MWRIVVAVVCIITVLVCGYINLIFSDRLCDTTSEHIMRAIESVDRTGSDDGRGLREVTERWQGSIGWLCIFIAHEQLDEAEAAFARAESYRRCGEWAEYRAELVDLLSVISVIRGYDHPDAINLL
ncbi:MAG: hypothetical protein ABT01_00055 [Clostridium sp. SCN 57-10]|nr:MAG: hypothetical protein ABT01_00055 [Clostridium sp. SCN 57-10]